MKILSLTKPLSMNRLIILFSALTSSLCSYSQQWVSENYEYDSLMNIEYGTAIDFLGTSVPLHMDLYLPICENPTGDSKTPLAIFIHGGSFLAGDKSETTITDLAKSFAKRGYASASINYRMGFVNEDGLNQCNMANYPCFFAADTAEWYRAYYRGVQDAKGAIRYLVNRHLEYQIDPSNIFIVGESAGAFIAMGAAFLDLESEKFTNCNAIGDLPIPNSNNATCPHYANQAFPTGMIARPDLGSINGTIEPTSIPFTIKAVGNFFGGMFSDLLALNDVTKQKPALYQFHQPCDLIVPFEEGKVYAGLNWCLTNGYGCNAIANSALVYGSKRISDWNSSNSYGYTIQDQFTTIPFPYEYIGFQPKNCYDQVVNGNGCHAYDSYSNRKTQLINFFSNHVSTSPICPPGLINLTEIGGSKESHAVYPNPFNQKLTIECPADGRIIFTDLFGREIFNKEILEGTNTLTFSTLNTDPEFLSDGIYIVKLLFGNEQTVFRVQKKN